VPKEKALKGLLKPFLKTHFLDKKSSPTNIALKKGLGLSSYGSNCG